MNGTIERNKKTVKLFLEGTHSPDIRNVDIIDTTVSPSIVCHGFPGGDFADRESYKNFFRVFRGSFSDMAFEAGELIADERFVAAPWTVQARHSGEFAGVKPDGRRIQFGGVAVYRMENGLIAETWLHIDQLALLSQIGAIRPLAA